MNSRQIMLKLADFTMHAVCERERPFGAAVVRNGKIISIAHNTVNTEKNPVLHAEINAISIAAKKLRRISLAGCKLYSTCEPCPMCFSAAHWANIDEIIYSCRISDAQKAGFHELTISNREMKKQGHSGIKITGPVYRKDVCRVFKEYLATMPKRN
jgi:tRNA(Arg) A34 adenosine deaminase TadA